MKVTMKASCLLLTILLLASWAAAGKAGLTAEQTMKMAMRAFSQMPSASAEAKMGQAI
jgi:hypothetical protein